jgi:branched-chain amino acid transport system substrate-binding protein
MHAWPRRTCAALAGLLVFAACSGDDSSATSTSSTTTTSTPDRFARGQPDGVFTIGVLLPRTGPGASLGDPLVDVISAAVQGINIAGGVNGHNVEVQVVDEAAAASADDVLDNPSIDAIIGPASSRVALAVLPAASDAGVASCSPTATSTALTDLPDHELSFRTVASDALEARAMARIIDQTGLGSVALVYPDDVYGRPYRDAVRDELTSFGVPIIAEVPYDPEDEDLSGAAEKAVADNVPVVAMIGDASSGGRMVAAMLAAGGSEPLIVANGGVRNADFGRVDLQALSERVSGVSVSAYDGATELMSILGSQELASAAFAAAAVDCVNLLALGANASAPDDPAAIVAAAIKLSVGGVPCQSFVQCMTTINEDRKADYNGPTGMLALDVVGDVTRANYDIYGFDEMGNDMTSGQVIATF